MKNCQLKRLVPHQEVLRPYPRQCAQQVLALKLKFVLPLKACASHQQIDHDLDRGGKDREQLQQP